MLYLNATGFDKKPAQVQCSTLLTVAKEEALENFNTFDITDEDEVKIDINVILHAQGKHNVRATCV